MRPIDADRLKTTQEIQMADFNSIEGVRAWIDRQPTIEQYGKWIPCSERLPEEKGYYLCVWRSENHPDGAIDVFNFDGKKFPWETVFLHQNNKVIAWMPLPEPYKEEKKDAN